MTMRPILCAIWGWILLSFCLSTWAIAQTPRNEIDYDAWNRMAERAELVIDASRASTPAFEELRARLVEFRARFSEAETTNLARVRSLQAQLDVLGPETDTSQTNTGTEAPEEPDDSNGQGASTAPLDEPAELAARRADLIDRLARAQAPGLRAQEAFQRADGLIGEIDAIIRERQTQELLARGPTPLSPISWGEAIVAVQSVFGNLAAETRRLLAARGNVLNSGGDLLEPLLFLVLAFVVVLRGRVWVSRLTGWIASQNVRGQPIATFLASLGEILVPFVGILALMAALSSTGLVGVRGSFVLDQLPEFALIFFTARWLGGRIFSSNEPYFDLEQATLREGRFYSSIIGLILGLESILASVAAFEGFAPGGRAVLEGALVVAGAVMLLRIGMMLLRQAAKQSSKEQSEDSENATEGVSDGGFRVSLERLCGRAAITVAVVAPVAGALGYSAVAAFLLFPMLNTLGLLAFLLILTRLTRSIYAAVRNVSTEDVQTALWPVFGDILFLLLSLPVFALIWGARTSDLTELWTRFLAGVSFGGTRISPMSFLTFAIVFVALYAATRLVQSAMRSTVLPKTKIDPGGQVALVSGVGYVGIFLAALVAITAAGIDLSNLALVAGALSIGIGFGLQTIVSNFVAGIILLIERPVAEGDWIEVNGTMGYVREISVRSTRIETFDRTDVIVPNADLVSGMVTNWTRGNLTGRVIVPVGVAYGTDTKQVEGILREIAEAHPLVIMKPPPNVIFRGFGADSMDFEIRAILRDINFMLSVQSDLNHAIAARFEAEGIEIPFAQRDVWLRNPETLRSSDKET